jgi:D-amino-acid dehydrogenase
MTGKRVVIIGGGVIGLCTALYASRRGHQVTIVDRGPATPRDGCSFGNAGMIVPSHFVPLAAPGMVWLGFKWMWNPRSPFYIKPRLSLELLDWGIKFCRAANADHVHRAAPVLRDLHLLSRRCYQDLAHDLDDDFGLTQNGLLMLCKTQEALDEESHMADQARQLGVPAEVLDPTQTAARDPDVRMDVAGSVYFPLDCHLSPNRFMAAVERKLHQANVQFEWNTEVIGWERAAGAIERVQTTKGPIAADEFVLCAGSWSPTIARDLGLHLPIQAGKGYSLTLPHPRQRPRICAIFTEARVAVTPMGDALRFGGTMEIAGLSDSINVTRVQGIIDSIPHYYPDFTPADFAAIQPWHGLRPCSPDGLPYLGRTAAFKNLTIATGHAMLGLSLGPATGTIVSQLLSGESPSQDLSILSPDRYCHG